MHVYINKKQNRWVVFTLKIQIVLCFLSFIESLYIWTSGGGNIPDFLKIKICNINSIDDNPDKDEDDF